MKIEPTIDPIFEQIVGTDLWVLVRTSHTGETYYMHVLNMERFAIADIVFASFNLFPAEWLDDYFVDPVIQADYINDWVTYTRHGTLSNYIVIEPLTILTTADLYESLEMPL